MAYLLAAPGACKPSGCGKANGSSAINQVQLFTCSPIHPLENRSTIPYKLLGEQGNLFPALPFAVLSESLKDFFDTKTFQYNQPDFIAADPICIPHSFTRQPDIEIAGLFAALFAWGNRTIIINKSKELLHRMDGAPYNFVLNAQASDLMRISGFVHRTFNATDIWYFIDFLRQHYQQYPSLETAFSQWLQPEDATIEPALNGFKKYFFELEHEKRTRKHISSPQQKSTCKRLNMYLRWMVRRDGNGVDFGLWKKISPAQLICPIDVHVARVARRFQLLQRKPLDWQAALDLTAHLRRMDPTDPVKYDFALFGLGVIEKF